MGERDLYVKAPDSGPGGPSAWTLGQAMAFQSSMWMVKGLFLAPTASGERELWYILGEHRNGMIDLEQE
jgi:hypothetical protein